MLLASSALNSSPCTRHRLPLFCVDKTMGLSDLDCGCCGTWYLPAWLGDVLEIGEVVLNPSVDVFQGHALPLCAIDGELYHGHVGVWGSLRHGVWPGCRRSRGPLHLWALRSQRERKIGHERRGHKASPAPPPPQEHPLEKAFFP